MKKTFQLTAAEIPEAMASYEGLCAVSRELERFYKANGMRTGRNQTAGEIKAEALHWAARQS